jgi:hypothetical protein
MKLKFSNMIKHFALVVKHRHKVFLHAVRCGIIWRGLVHDLSKFSPTEFLESARFYQGNRSPIGVCRRQTGKSLAWLHHKGRNKHHPEYWYDADCPGEQPMMPYAYAVECICDKLAATKTYKGKDYAPDMPLLHWQTHCKDTVCNPKTRKFIDTVFTDLKAHGEKYILNKKYMRATYERICSE